MATVLKLFQKQSLPTRNDVELPDAVRREVNSAVQKVLEEERMKLVEESRNILTLHQEIERKSPSTQLSVETQRQ